MTADPSTAATMGAPDSGTDAPAASPSEGASAPDGPAAVMHDASAQPPTDGGIWTAPARSEQPGDHVPAPDGWTNPPAFERYGPTQPPEHPVWTPSHGGTTGPYELGVTAERAPEGYENPPSRTPHGPGPGA